MKLQKLVIKSYQISFFSFLIVCISKALLLTVYLRGEKNETKVLSVLLLPGIIVSFVNLVIVEANNSFCKLQQYSSFRWIVRGKSKSFVFLNAALNHGFDSVKLKNMNLMSSTTSNVCHAR